MGSGIHKAWGTGINGDMYFVVEASLDKVKADNIDIMCNHTQQYVSF